MCFPRVCIGGKSLWSSSGEAATVAAPLPQLTGCPGQRWSIYPHPSLQGLFSSAEPTGKPDLAKD